MTTEIQNYTQFLINTDSFSMVTKHWIFQFNIFPQWHQYLATELFGTSEQRLEVMYLRGLIRNALIAESDHRAAESAELNMYGGPGDKASKK